MLDKDALEKYPLGQCTCDWCQAWESFQEGMSNTPWDIGERCPILLASPIEVTSAVESPRVFTVFGYDLDGKYVEEVLKVDGVSVVETKTKFVKGMV